MILSDTAAFMPPDSNKSFDRVLKLELMAGKTAKSVSGLTDNRLFTGAQSLHLVMDLQTNLWSFKYENGLLPGGLQGQFTSFSRAYDFAENYFKKRNVLIKEVLD